jgi:hypothetical protein
MSTLFTLPLHGLCPRLFFFNISHATCGALVWWIAIVTISYAFLTVEAIFDPKDLFYTPFSLLVLRIYLVFPLAVSQVCSWIKPLRGFSAGTRKHYRDLRDRYSGGLIEGKVKSAEEAASKPSWIIDTEILGRILRVRDDDHALEAFSDAIPGSVTQS